MELSNQPESIMTDYESGVIAAVKKIFVVSTHWGCWFHFSLCIFRKFQDFGLQKGYQDENLKKIAQKLFSLAFLPENEIEAALGGFEAEIEEDPIFSRYPEIGQIFAYMWNFWIFGRISLTLWNVFDRPLNLRTTNKCESWNRDWNASVGTKNPVFWTVVQKLGEQEQYSRLDIRRISRGEASNIQKKKYRDLNEKISRLKNSYLDGTSSLKNYWEGVSNICSNFRN